MVVDIIPLPPSLLALLGRHVQPVPLAPLVRIDNRACSMLVVLWPWRCEKIAEEAWRQWW
jgi:hypothetical protein